MSLAEIQSELSHASVEDKLRLLAWLKHDLRTGTPARQRQLSEYRVDMEQGDKVSLADLKKINRSLDQAGL